MSDWKNVQYKDGKLRTNNGDSGGASALSDLTDVDLTNIADGQIIKWDATNEKWVNANESGGGGGSYSSTLLWDYINDNSGNIPYGTFTSTLHSSINNYDVIIVEMASSSGDLTNNDWRSTCQLWIDVNGLNNAYNPGYITYTSFDQRASRFYLSGTTFSKTVNNQANTNGVIKVLGIKY